MGAGESQKSSQLTKQNTEVNNLYRKFLSMYIYITKKTVLHSPNFTDDIYGTEYKS